MTDAAPIHLYSLGVPRPGVTRRIDWTWGMIPTPHSRFQVLGFHSRASPGPRLPISQVQVAPGGGEALPPHVFVHSAPRVPEPLPVPALCCTGGKATSRARVCLRGAVEQAPHAGGPATQPHVGAEARAPGRAARRSWFLDREPPAKPTSLQNEPGARGDSSAAPQVSQGPRACPPEAELGRTVTVRQSEVFSASCLQPC